MIDKFRGEHFFLSNFYECPVVFEGQVYPTSEHAFQAAKTLNLEERQRFTDPLIPPGGAKAYGRQVTLRPDWETIKFDVMRAVLKDKFTKNIDLHVKLLATGTHELVEGNSWGDESIISCSLKTLKQLSHCLGSLWRRGREPLGQAFDGTQS